MMEVSTITRGGEVVCEVDASGESPASGDGALGNSQSRPEMEVMCSNRVVEPKGMPEPRLDHIVPRSKQTREVGRLLVSKG